MNVKCEIENLLSKVSKRQMHTFYIHVEASAHFKLFILIF